MNRIMNHSFIYLSVHNFHTMNREHFLEVLANRKQWDVAVIGGGATGLGIAVDASLRGFSVVLIEAFDFCKGTSSRSTKLVHGGGKVSGPGRCFSCDGGFEGTGDIVAECSSSCKGSDIHYPGRSLVGGSLLHHRAQTV